MKPARRHIGWKDKQNGFVIKHHVRTRMLSENELHRCHELVDLLRSGASPRGRKLTLMDQVEVSK